MNSPDNNHTTASTLPFIGTSGWQHAHWRSRFYPAQLPTHAWLDHYGQQLNAVELDGGRLAHLDANLAATWRSTVPAHFSFTIQAPRTITHVHKLRNCSHLVTALLDRLHRLEQQLGPIIFSLPPRWHCNIDRLEHFLGALPAGFRYAFEFHDRDWLRPETFALLQRHGAALCLNDRMPLDSLSTITSDYTYARLYGPPAHGRYNSLGLRTWATRISAWQRRKLACYVLFQNDLMAYAAKNACLLRDFEDLRPLRRQIQVGG